MKGQIKMGRGRKLKAKDSNASLLSFSTAGSQKKDSNTSEVVTMSKKVVEKLSFLVNQHREFVEKSTKQLYVMSNSNKEDKLCELYELLSIHKTLMGRSQLGLYDANFLIHVGELAESLENNRTKIRTEAKRYSVENRDLKTKLTYLINRLIEMEGNLAKAKEEMYHWETLSKIRLLDGEEETEKLEKMVWDMCILVDGKDLPNLSDEVSDILDAVNEGGANEAGTKYKAILSKMKPKQGVDDAAEICLMAKRMSEEDIHKFAIEFMDTALNFRRTSAGVPSVLFAYTLSAKAIVVGKMGNTGLAAKLAFDALQCMDASIKNRTSDINVGRQYLITGFLLAKWNFPQEGIKIMECALLMIENLLPGEEEIWMETIVKMAKTCNDCKFHDDTLTITGDLIDYFHEIVYGPISKKNQPIYEVAAECQRADSATAKLIAMNGPKPTCLSPLVSAALREVIIAYSSRYEFGSAKIVENFLKDCLKLEDPDGNNAIFGDDDNLMSKELKADILGRRPIRAQIFGNKKGILTLKEAKVNLEEIKQKVLKAAGAPPQQQRPPSQSQPQQQKPPGQQPPAQQQQKPPGQQPPAQQQQKPPAQQAKPAAGPPSQPKK